jgi:hemerythrin superfamily protein
MNCLDLLTQQHRVVDSLFDQIKAAATEGMRYSLFEQVAEALAMHAKIEEQIFYPAVKFDDTMDLLKDSVQEHLEAKRLLVDLMEAETDDTFDTKFQDLVNGIKHHVNEEETELFPKVRQHLDDGQLDEIGNQLQALMDKLSKEEDIAENVQEETGAPARI